MLHVIHSKSYEQVLRGYSLTLDAFDPFVAGFDAVSGQFVQFCVRGKITQYKSALVQSIAGAIGMVVLLMIPPGLTVTGLIKEKL